MIHTLHILSIYLPQNEKKTKQEQKTFGVGFVEKYILLHLFFFLARYYHVILLASSNQTVS